MFDDRLKKLREATHITQREAAKKIGMMPRTYASYENNEREPNSETLLKLSEFFNVSIDYLLGRNAPKDTNKPNAYEQEQNEINDLRLKNEIISLVRMAKVSQRQLRELIGIIKVMEDENAKN
jgi:transcriptional regulator with XRE-family HTH domain